MKCLSQSVNEQLSNCYEVHGRKILDGERRFTLVHGMVAGQKNLSGYRYGHCWFEHGDLVYDFSNGIEIVIPKILYYAVGQIDPKKTKYYTPSQVNKMLMKHGHWGPWEMSGDKEKI